MKRFSRIVTAVSVGAGVLLAYVACQTLFPTVFLMVAMVLSGGSQVKAFKMYEIHKADVYLASSLFFAACLVGALLIYKKVKQSHFTDFLQKPQTETLSLFMMSAFLLGTTLNIGFSNLISLIPLPDQWVADNAESVNAFSESNVLIMLIAQSIAAPLVEELIFRGVMYHGLRQAPVATNRKLCVGICAVIVSGVFGWIHGNILQALYCFIFSLILIWLVEATGSLWGAIVTHIGFNSPWVLMLCIGQWYDSDALVLNCIVFLVLSVLLLFLTLWAGGVRFRRK